MSRNLEFVDLTFGDAGFDEALANLLVDAGRTEVSTESAARDWRSDALSRGVCCEPVTTCFWGARRVGTAASLDMPGGSAILMISQRPPTPVSHGVLSGLVERQLKALRCRSTRFVEILVHPDDVLTPKVLQALGFTYLTRLTFLYHALGGVTRPPIHLGLRWAPYHEGVHARFVEVLRRSYVGSEDCPELTRLRTAEEALRTHRAASESGTGLWALVQEAEQDVAVLLPSHHARLRLTEINYMGVIPEARGRRIAEAMILAVAEGASGRGDTNVALSVDRRNLVARKLYDRCGFRSGESRDAWLLCF